MDIMQILPWAIFGFITCVVLGFLSFMSSRKSRTLERLEELRDPTLRSKEKLAKKKTGMAAALERAAPKLSQALTPKSEVERNSLKLRLANAGFYSPNGVSVFLSIKLLLLAVFSVAGAATGFTVWGFTMKGWYGVLGGAVAGFYIPEVVLTLIKRGRQDRIFLQLPDALDLLVVCVEAGLGLDAGMRRVTEELAETAPDICSEFDRCNMQLQMGKPRRECLRELGLRTGVDDVRSLVTTLINAERFGSSVGSALRIQSDTMRTKRRQQAEERAQKTAVQMLFPLVLFIFPGIFVVLVGPAAIMMMQNLFK